MTLKFPLTEEICKIINNETVDYALPLDISEEGNFGGGFFIITKDRMLLFYDDELRTEKFLEEYRDFTTEMCVGGGAFFAVNVKSGLKEKICRFTMEHGSRYSLVARKLQLRYNGKSELLSGDEPDKRCPKCGRILPESSGICPYCTDKKAVIFRIIRMFKKYIPLICFQLVLLLAMTGLGTLMPLIYSEIVNNVYLSEESARNDDLIFYFVCMLGAYVLAKLVSTAIEIVRGRLTASMSNSMMHELRMMMFDKIQRLSVGFAGKRTIGDLMNRVTIDTTQIRNFLQDHTISLISQAFSLVLSAVLMFSMNWKLALIVIIPAPLIVVCQRLWWTKIRRIYTQLRQLSSRSDSILQDVFSGIKVVKAFGAEDKEVRRFSKVSNQYREKTLKNEYFWATFQPVIGMINQLTYFAVALIGGLAVLDGKMSIGALTAFTSYANMIYSPIQYLADVPKSFAATMTSATRVFDVLDQKSDVPDSEEPKELDINGHVEYKDVTFGYKSYDPVTEDINIDIAPGEMIGLVGHSGSGKSTLTNLLMRFYDVDGGGIFIDGVNIKEIAGEKLHNQIGVVLQETYLFDGTIKENIRYSKPDATEEEIIEACKTANAHDFITNFPDGYDTRIGERGQRLSGGEKQRIAIARAIICNPKILILDEATASLDTENELVIQTALQRLIEGRTTVAIAHRLSTLKNADRLVVLDHGRVAETGTHNELIDRKGIYYNLVMAQLNMTRLLGDVETTDSQFIDEIKKK